MKAEVTDAASLTGASPGAPRSDVHPSSFILHPSEPPPVWRAPLVGALLIPLGAFCAVYGYTVIQAVHWNQQSLKLGPIFLLFLLVCVNAAVRWARRRCALTQGGLALVYSMVLGAPALGGLGRVVVFVSGM